MGTRKDDEVRAVVRAQYGRIATQGEGCGCAPGCCGPSAEASARPGHPGEQPAGAPGDPGLGCGNPHALAALRPGETVLDLGCGGGLDCFVASRQVGPTGHVIGVDMTPEMITRARVNQRAAGASNVEFRLGEIEHLPVADATVDVILSNCVVNLSPDKAAVFREALRVLKPGGRLAISDIVETAPLPEALRQSTEALIGCVGGAASVERLRALLRDAGFEDVHVEVRAESREMIRGWLPGSGAEQYVAAADLTARRPLAR